MEDESRQKLLNAHTEIKGDCVLYVMSRDQRVADNHALLQAQALAIARDVPLAVVFCLLPKVANRSREQYQWMLAGLKQVEEQLGTYNIPFMMLIGEPKQTLAGMLHHTRPSAIYFDMNPLRGPRLLQDYIANLALCPVYVVDTHNIVPVWVVSDKQEYSARTIRPKVHRHLADFLSEPKTLVKHPVQWPGIVKTMHDLDDMIKTLLAKVPANNQKLTFVSGGKQAKKVLSQFIQQRLRGYATLRNDPTKNGQSELSPYLHFGQIARSRIALDVGVALQNKQATSEDVDTFLEELNIRSALSDNYCYYNPKYDSLDGAPAWARATLEDHAKDPREFMYSPTQLEHAQTHDPAWNAAQRQLTQTGKMHGYMRMYWAKKVLEWSKSPEDALATLIWLNDFYSLDGGDPNGYVGILWSIAGLHDRPWFRRPIYGTIRYMNYNGLKRKFKIATYIEQYHD